MDFGSAPAGGQVDALVVLTGEGAEMKDRLWKSLLSGLLLLLFVSFIGCASTRVKPDNFANFSDAVKTVENATDKSLIIRGPVL